MPETTLEGGISSDADKSQHWRTSAQSAATPQAGFLRRSAESMESQEQFRQARLRRHNQAMLQQQVIPNNFNDPFKYHPPKRTSAKKATRKSSGSTTVGHNAPEVSDSDSDFDDASSSSSSSAPTLAGYRRLTIAVTVGMYQYTSAAHVTRLGSRGLALAGDEFANSPQTVVAYDLSSKAQFLQVPVDASFSFTLVSSELLPSGADRAPAAARFSDGLNDWLVCFSDPAHLADFCMNVAMSRNIAQARASARGAARSTIAQDLCLGSSRTGAEVRVGDKVRVRYSMSSIGAQGRLAAAVAQDVTKTFDVGTGGVPPGVEQGIIGMRKGDVRFLIIPRILAGAATEWGPHVPGDAELAVEVTLERHKVSEQHAQERADAGVDTAAAPAPAAVVAPEPGAGRRRASMTAGASTAATAAAAPAAATGKASPEDDIFNATLIKPGQKTRASFSAASKQPRHGTSDDNTDAADYDDDEGAGEAADIYPVPLTQGLSSSAGVPASASAPVVVPTPTHTSTAAAAVVPGTGAGAGAGEEEALIDRMRRISEAGHRAALPSAASAGTPRLAPMASVVRAPTPVTTTATASASGSSPAPATGAAAAAAGAGAARAPAPNAVALPAMSLAPSSSGNGSAFLSPASPAAPSAAALSAAAASGAVSATTPAADVLRLLGMDTLVSALAAHAVDTFDDMTMLEDADWKQVVPQIGARRKLQLRVAELASLVNGGGGGLPPPRSTTSSDSSAAAAAAAAAAEAEAFARSQADAQARAQAEARADADAARAARDASARDATARAALAEAEARAKEDVARAHSDAYEQGRAAATAAARARIDAMKDMANERFAALTAELAQAREELAQAHTLAEDLRVALAAAEKEGSKARETMRAYVERTREQRKEEAAELAAAKAAVAEAVEVAKGETAELKAQAREYVVKVKESGKAEKRALVKQVSEAVFVRLNEAFNANDVLDGETILSKIKDVIKASAQETLQQID